MRKVVLVTGASSGIGETIADRFAAGGWQVFGTDPGNAAAAARDRVRGLVLDVTDDASVALAVAAVGREAGRIDALINNAGVALAGPLEEISAAQAMALFDVNLFGIMRVTNAVLPLMRAQRSGRIVNMSSLAGLLPAPYLGIYSASKHALEGYSEALAGELGGFGVSVALVEPGFVRTGLGRAAATGENPLAAYDAIRQRALAGLRRAVEDGNPPAAVADAVWRAATARRPRMRYPVGTGARSVRLLRALLPRGLLQWNMRRQLHIESFKPLAILFRRGRDPT
jgi:NAD(P)-dependent dehydrogenase (short-subunit alcohol dehydrogenase family)